jgi:hypothetical protein
MASSPGTSGPQRDTAPVIFDVMPLSAVARAHSLLENATITGRIALDPWTAA